MAAWNPSEREPGIQRRGRTALMVGLHLGSETGELHACSKQKVSGKIQGDLNEAAPGGGKEETGGERN